MKKLLFAVVFLAVVFASAVVYLFVLPKNMPGKNNILGAAGQNTNGILKTVNFSGKLEKVDTGCFADGECFVQVDGKHITTLLGFNRNEVGSVQGVENFGSLQELIGKEVEVYAQDKGDGSYTLYGNKDFYIKVK